MRLSKIRLNGRVSSLYNIVIIIGSNNAGKTKLLENLYFELINSYEQAETRDYIRRTNGHVYWEELTEKDAFTYNEPELAYWLACQEPWRVSQSMPNRGKMLMHSRKHILQRALNEDGALIQERIDQIKSGQSGKGEWFSIFKKSHIDYANIDNRFSAANVLNDVDSSSDDNADLYYMEKRTIKSLSRHIGKLFSKVFVRLKTSRTNWGLILIDDKQKHLPAWARSNDFEADTKTIKDHAEYRTKYANGLISEQSHGTRAALSILMMLADKTKKIMFIDEPESHIYPAARKYLARQIAKDAGEKQFFVVTHDVDFLEGIGLSRKDFTVIKVNRKREAKVVGFNAVERRRTSSELKNSKALRAGFYDVAVFVEGPTDRYIYESILTRKKLIPNDIEYGVIDCDGNDRIADSIKFALDIGTSIAVITDFDTVLNKKKKKVSGLQTGILESLPIDSKIMPLLNDVRAFMQNKQNAKKGLNAKGLTSGQKTKIEVLLAELKKTGIFVVPCGELYDWFTKDKAEAAVEDLRNRYFNNTKKYSALTAFLKEVSVYVSQ